MSATVCSGCYWNQGTKRVPNGFPNMFETKRNCGYFGYVPTKLRKCAAKWATANHANIEEQTQEVNS